MTTDELLRTLAPLSRASIYRDLRALKIQPLGIRQRPQRWPADAADKIRVLRGMVAAPAMTASLPEPVKLTFYKGGKMIPLAKLERVRKQARKGKGAR